MAAFEEKHRFKLPTDWSPAGTRCVVFTIPDDPEYFGQIIGLVDALKFSNNFGRDPTRSGAATVSRTWQSALESRPVFSLENCEIGGIHDMSMYDTRVHPSKPWVQQATRDGGVTWHDSLIQPHWETIASGTEPTIDTAHAADRAADRIVRGVYQWSMDELIGAVSGGVPKEMAVNAMLGKMSGYVANVPAMREALNQAFDMVTDLPTPTADKYASGATDEECCETYYNFWNHMSDLFTKYPEASTDKLAEMLQDGITNGVDQVITGLSGIAQAMGTKIHDFAQWAGNGFQGDHRFDNCDWVMTWDFTGAPGDWEAGIPELNIGCPVAVWDAGLGWGGAEFCEEGDDIWTSAVIRTKVRPTYITDWSVEVAFDSPSLNAIGMKVIGELGGVLTDSVSNQASNSMNPTPGTEWPVQFVITANCVNYAHLHIIEASFIGLGANPWAPELTDPAPPW